jgi:hypothetical protein
MTSQFIRKVTFDPAYDKRHPDPKKNYGVHGVHIRFTIKNTEEGQGLSFSIGTNWHLSHVQEEINSQPLDSRFPFLFHHPQAFGVDIHQKAPNHESQPSRENCDLVDGPCFCDGSSFLGEKFLQTLIEKGDEGLFTQMEEQYFLWSRK